LFSLFAKVGDDEQDREYRHDDRCLEHPLDGWVLSPRQFWADPMHKTIEH
jgi:hypothetical protein